jgi:hypothetical protein
MVVYIIIYGTVVCALYFLINALGDRQITNDMGSLAQNNMGVAMVPICQHVVL